MSAFDRLEARERRIEELAALIMTEVHRCAARAADLSETDRVAVYAQVAAKCLESAQISMRQTRATEAFKRPEVRS